MDDDALMAARAEAARQAVMLAAMLIAVPVIAWLERKATQPDAARELRMRAAKAGERLCARAAALAWRRAERYRQAYESDRG